MTLRSEEVLRHPLGSAKRVLFKSMGFTDNELNGPIIGVANAWSTLVSGHFNLRNVADRVRSGIAGAGGMAVEFGVPGICDGIAENHRGAHFVLPSRDLIANSIEVMAEAHALDGIVLLGSCDKTVPAMLMAATRVDLPAIMVVGGPAEGGSEVDGRSLDSTTVDEALPMLESGQMDETEFFALEDSSQPTCGSCAFLGTANSMCCAAEALGLSLPGTATIPAVHSARLQMARLAGERIVGLVNENLSARKIVNRASLENAIRTMAAHDHPLPSGPPCSLLGSDPQGGEDGAASEDADRLHGDVPHCGGLPPGALRAPLAAGVLVSPLRPREGLVPAGPR